MYVTLYVAAGLSVCVDPPFAKMLSGTVSDEPSSVYVIVMVPSLLNLYPNAPEKA